VKAVHVLGEYPNESEGKNDAGNQHSFVHNQDFGHSEISDSRPKNWPEEAGHYYAQNMLIHNVNPKYCNRKLHPVAEAA